MARSRRYRILSAIILLPFVVLVLLILFGPDDFYQLEVSLIGAGITHPEPGSHLTTPGSTVYLNAEPAPNTDMGFVRWQGDSSSSDERIAILMDGHKRVTAVFGAEPSPGKSFRSLTIALAGQGQGTTSPPPGKYLHISGKEVTLQALPGQYGYFAGWTDPAVNDTGAPGEIKTVNPRRTIKMDEDRVLIAVFQPQGSIITLETAGEGIIEPPPGDYALAVDTHLGVYVFPAEGWRLRQWEDAAGNILHPPHYHDGRGFLITPQQGAHYRAIFEKAERTLTLRTEFEGAAQGHTIPPSSPEGAAMVMPYGKHIVLQARAEDPDSAFAGWYGDFPEDFFNTQFLAPLLPLVMTENHEVSARFVERETQLTINVLVDGSPDPEAAERIIPAPGTYGFVRHEAARVELAAPLAEGSPFAFVRWVGTLPTGTDPCQPNLLLDMREDREITAHFTREQALSVVITHSGEGLGQTTPSPGRYALAPGHTVNLEAFTREDCVFGGWRLRTAKGDDLALLDNPLKISLNAPSEIEAFFGREPCSLSIQATEKDTITRPARGGYQVAKGALLDIEAFPPMGKYFHHWKDSKGNVVSEETRMRITMAGDEGYTAVFGPPMHAIQITVFGRGTVESAGETTRIDRVVAGQVAQLVARPAPDAVFSHWEGDLARTADPLQPELFVLMDADKAIQAHFDDADHQLTVKAAGHSDSQETILIPGPGVHGFRAGEAVLLSAFPPPNSGLAFLGWSGDVTSINPQVTVVMDRDLEVNAVFGPAEEILTSVLTLLPLEGEGRGVLHPIGPGAYHFTRGARLNLSVRLQEDTYFGGWTHDYAGAIQYQNLEIVLDRDITLGAVLSKRGNALILMLDSEEGGSIEPPAGIYRLADGVRVTLHASRANTRYTFIGWHNAAGELLSGHGRFTFSVKADIPKIEILAMFRPYISPPELVFCNSVRHPQTLLY